MCPCACLRVEVKIMLDLYRVIQPVKNIEEAARFYSHVLGIPGERVSPGRHYFICGHTILACYDPITDGDGNGNGWSHHFNQYLYFAMADLEGMQAKVANAGGKITAPIEAMPWGERMFYARDPFGNPISFVDERTVFRGSPGT
jgi:predicted enzyme related to lactoylglutathione lyase